MNNIIIEKSSQDSRSYKLLSLDNKLTVLLIKDKGTLTSKFKLSNIFSQKETDKSAACMSVNIGSICDPSDS